MLFPLTSPYPTALQDLFAPLDYNLSILSAFAGHTPARVYADDPNQPAAALIAFKHHLFLAGSPEKRGIPQDLNDLIRGTLFPPALEGGGEIFMLHLSSTAWEAHLDQVLAGWNPRKYPRAYLECTEVLQDWRVLLDESFHLHPVDADLVAQSHLANIDYLREELCSERPTIEDFLAKSFGFCLLQGDELAGWCLSEYNTRDRCEVGVATVEKYQRRGLGTVTTLALVEHALENGYRRVGWHCWSGNTASVALAQRAGFVKVRDYAVYVCEG